MKIPTPPSLQDISINLHNVWVGISACQLIRPVVFPNRPAGSCTISLGLMIYQYPWEMCLLFSVNSWFVNDWAPPHCQTVPESDFRWTVDSTWRPSQLVCRIPVVNSVQSWLCGTKKPSYIQNRWIIFYSNEEKLKVVVTSMGTTQRICCRSNTNITHVSWDTGVWKYVDWDFCIISMRIIHQWIL